MRSLRMIQPVAALAMLAGLVSGCGASAASPATAAGSAAEGTSPAGGGATGADATGEACGLFTLDELSTAMGRPITKATGAPRGLLDFAICTWAGSDPSDSLAARILYTQSAMQLDLQQEPGAQHIDGLGDDAFATKIPSVFVRKGGRGLELTEPGCVFSADDVRAQCVSAMTDLARKALGKL